MLIFQLPGVWRTKERASLAKKFLASVRAGAMGGRRVKFRISRKLNCRKYNFRNIQVNHWLYATFSTYLEWLKKHRTRERSATPSDGSRKFSQPMLLPLS
jgi:hypothetical protein